MTIKNKQELCALIESALRQTPSVVGRRLRSEEDLAALFSVGRWSLRSAMDRLVDEGILVRRKGSGTYVRKMPEGPKAGETKIVPADPFLAKKLFADTHEAFSCAPASLQLPQNKSGLLLSVWSGMHYFDTPSNLMILGGISQRVSQTRNSLQLNTMLEHPNVPHVLLPLPEVARRLRENPCDGYLVAASWAEIFEQALEGRKAPVLYFIDVTYRLSKYPLVMVDTYGEFQTAVTILAEQGYRRIALLGLSSWLNDEAQRQEIYDAAIKKAGLDYHQCFFVCLGECLNYLKKVLTQPNRPDAIYVQDDHLMSEVSGALTIAGLEPGKDIGIIVQNVAGRPLPGHCEWSEIDFDLDYFSERLVDDILKMIHSANTKPYTTGIHGIWKPQKTHLRR